MTHLPTVRIRSQRMTTRTATEREKMTKPRKSQVQAKLPTTPQVALSLLWRRVNDLLCFQRLV